MIKALDDSRRNGRGSKVKTLLFRYGYVYVWIRKEIGDASFCGEWRM